MYYWKVMRTRYRGKLYPCICFYKGAQIQSSMILSHGWSPDLFVVLADQIEIESGR